MLLLIFWVYFIKSKLVYIAIFSNKCGQLSPIFLFIRDFWNDCDWILAFFSEGLVLITWTEQMILNLHYQISEYEALFGISNKNNFYSFQLESQQVQKF